MSRLDGPRIALVACGASKLGTRARAADLYTGNLFRHQRAYAERCCDHWYILSAKHGLVDPDTELDPYECTLATFSVAEREAWGDRVVTSFVRQWGDVVNVTPVLLAGSAYLGALRGKLVQLEHRQDVDVAWRAPIAPLARLGIGLQMAWLKAEVAEVGVELAASARRPGRVA